MFPGRRYTALEMATYAGWLGDPDCDYTIFNTPLCHFDNGVCVGYQSDCEQALVTPRHRRLSPPLRFIVDAPVISMGHPTGICSTGIYACVQVEKVVPACCGDADCSPLPDTCSVSCAEGALFPQAPCLSLDYLGVLPVPFIFWFMLRVACC